MSIGRAALLTLFLTLSGGVLLAQSGGEQAPEAPAPTGDGRVFEMRKYYAMPGKLADLNTRFRDHTCALFQKHGMELIGFWEPTEGPEAGRVLVYVLAYPSQEARKKAWDGFRDDPEWHKARDASEKNGKIVEKIESTIMKATDYSAIR